MSDEGSDHVVPHDDDNGDLDLMMKVAAVRSDNHVGISSFVFSNTGRGLYMSTCNELQEIRLANQGLFSKTHNALIKDESSFQFILSIQN